jgi:diguanylate cyclase (GGDEF)-like protein/PAS domain S-box-containing protein
MIMDERIKQLLPKSIVARTTLSIILLAMLLGTLFAGGATWILHHNERTRLEGRLGELLSTVEKTVSIACFVKDDALARDIVSGLMVNHVVAGARIMVDGSVLYEQMPASDTPDARATLSITRQIHSPFDPDEVVGEIALYASESTLQALAWSYARYVLYVLGLEVALVALAVAWVVYNLITRPIKSISDELHRLELRTGMRLHVPLRNKQDELGRLVSDVNALIAKLTTLIDTERTLRMEREASERRLALIFEKVDAGIFEVERNGLLHSWNPAFVRTLGAPPEPPQLQALIPCYEHVRTLIDESLASGEPRETDLELRRPDGHTQWAELSLTPVDARMLQGVINDITERKRAELAAQQLAQRDTLTGLLNRRGLEAGLKAVFERREREPLPVALMMMDLDYFKKANDTYGHAAGDILLKRVAEILERTVRRTDLVARLGGDEFVIALVNTDSPAKAEQIAQAMIAEIRKPIVIDGGVQVHIGASVGIAMAGAGEGSAAVLQRADEGLYAAKEAGRCRVAFAQPLPVEL